MRGNKSAPKESDTTYERLSIPPIKVADKNSLCVNVFAELWIAVASVADGWMDGHGCTHDLRDRTSLTRPCSSGFSRPSHGSDWLKCEGARHSVTTLGARPL